MKDKGLRMGDKGPLRAPTMCRSREMAGEKGIGSRFQVASRSSATNARSVRGGKRSPRYSVVENAANREETHLRPERIFAERQTAGGLRVVPIGAGNGMKAINLRGTDAATVLQDAIFNPLTRTSWIPFHAEPRHVHHS